MNAWTKNLGVEKVKMIPDGSGEFTRDMDMLVFKPAQTFGYRSWRYAMIINDMEIQNMFIVDGKNQMDLDDDPSEVTKPENILRNIA
jgi:peroxiredoxin